MTDLQSTACHWRCSKQEPAHGQSYFEDVGLNVHVIGLEYGVRVLLIRHLR